MSKRRRRSLEADTRVGDVFDTLRSDYNATRRSRYRRERSNVPWSGASADYHLRSATDHLRLMELARDMDRNDVIIGQAIDRAVDNIVQQGFTLDANSGDPELDKAITADHLEWASDPDQCDAAGELAYGEKQWLDERQMLVDGDVVELPLREGSLQCVEAHRVRTPSSSRRKNVVSGVVMNKRRRREEYWITKEEIDPLKPLGLMSEIKPYRVRDGDGNRQLFHVYNARRATQTRGVTALAPLFDLAAQFEDIQFAKLVQEQIVSCFAILHEVDAGIRTSKGAQKGEQETVSLEDGTTRTIEGIAPGMEIFGSPGARMTGFSPNIPQPEYFPHVRLVLTLLGVNLGLPLVLLIMDASETNFSGWRGAVDQARLGFRRNQFGLENRLLRPAHRWRCRRLLKRDRAVRRLHESGAVNVFRHDWVAPTWPYIQPLQDAQTDLLQMRNALTSPRRIQAERSRNWETITDEIVEDNALAIEKAMKRADKINAAHGEQKVHWRELISLPTPDGLNLTVGASAGGQSDGSESSDGGRRGSTE